MVIPAAIPHLDDDTDGGGEANDREPNIHTHKKWRQREDLKMLISGVPYINLFEKRHCIPGNT